MRGAHAPWFVEAGPEITDLILDIDPVTLARRPVSRAHVVDTFLGHGMRWAAFVAGRLPVRDGILVDAEVDALFVRVHAEMQRLWEEFLQGERVRQLLLPLLSALREEDPHGTIRIVDVGCGLGYVIRWLAQRGDLGPNIELVGCDYNRALVQAASHLAREEGLRCAFRVANAFTLAEPATLYLSTGVLHHFRGPDLTAFFAQQRNAKAFVHFDIKASPIAPFGSLLFHVAKMREPVAQHDGTQSAVRAHPVAFLAQAAQGGAGTLRISLFDGGAEIMPTMVGVVGVQAALESSFRAALGSAASRLEAV